ncbi:MAG: glucose-1-phosphate thymidylyltransferase, partial [Chloroflexota bacterium]|nr:glucose-1-phosphate thymidylyltransferase [Chloroflexota bacterium]
GPDSYERALQGMIDDGRSLRCVEYAGSWAPMKYPWHVLAATNHFLDRHRGHIAASAVISERATIEGEVIVDEGARVLEGAVVRGPCYIGRDSVIGNHVLVRDYAHIGADCVVGAGTEIKHSYVGDGCWFHRNYVGDSVVGNHCSLGAGTVTANLRFDGGEVSVYDDRGGQGTGMDKLGAMIGPGSKTGVNVSIMPGVKIGPGSVVGPHVPVRRNVAPNSTLFLDADGAVVERRARPEEGEKGQVV